MCHGTDQQQGAAEEGDEELAFKPTSAEITGFVLSLGGEGRRWRGHLAHSNLRGHGRRIGVADRQVEMDRQTVREPIETREQCIRVLPYVRDTDSVHPDSWSLASLRKPPVVDFGL